MTRLILVISILIALVITISSCFKEYPVVKPEMPATCWTCEVRLTATLWRHIEDTCVTGDIPPVFVYGPDTLNSKCHLYQPTTFK